MALSYASQTIFIELGFSGSDTVGLKYANFCTNFNHDGVSSTFTGKAMFSGGSVVRLVGGTSSSTLSAAPNLTFTVATGLWNTTVSYSTSTIPVSAAFLLSLVNHTLGLPIGLSGFTLVAGTSSSTVTRLDGTVAFQDGGFLGGGTSSFLCNAFMEVWANNDDNMTALNTECGLQLSRGGTCPV